MDRNPRFPAWSEASAADVIIGIVVLAAIVWIFLR